MRDLFGIMKLESHNEKVKIAKKQLMKFNTYVHAFNNGNSDTSKKICYDSYHEVVSNIKDILQSVSKDYNTKSDLLSVLGAAQKDFEEKISPKWNDINKNAKKYINQLFQDSTSERIYSYDAAMAVINLMKDMTAFFSSENDATKKIKALNSLSKKCTKFCEDSSFDSTAGRSMKNIGYRDIANVYTVSNEFGNVLSKLSEEQVVSTLEYFQNKAKFLASETATLDTILSNAINSGKELDTTAIAQYDGVLNKAVTLKKVHRATVLMSGLITMLNKTVTNVIDSAYNARGGEVLKNMTHDMGGQLTPNIIETQAVANEGFLGRWIDRVSTAWKDYKRDITRKNESANDYMKFINEHLDPNEVESYLKTTRFRLVPLSDFENMVKSASKLIKSNEKLIDKFASARTYQEMFKEPWSKFLDVPELLKLHADLQRIGIPISFSWYDQYAGKHKYESDFKKVKNLLEDSEFSAVVKYDDMLFPMAYVYMETPERLYRIRLQTADRLGIATINDLERCVAVSNNAVKELYVEGCVNICFPRSSYKDTSGIDESNLRKQIVVNFYRYKTFMQMIYMLFDALISCIYCPYDVVKSVKKYA